MYELEALREIDCPEVSWGAWRPKKRTPSSAMLDAEEDDQTEHQSEYLRVYDTARSGKSQYGGKENV